VEYLKPPDPFLKYRKWYILTPVPIAILICYIVAERGVMTLLFGEQIATTFPYSFVTALILFGFLSWFYLMITTKKFHRHISKSRQLRKFEEWNYFSPCHFLLFRTWNLFMILLQNIYSYIDPGDGYKT